MTAMLRRCRPSNEAGDADLHRPTLDVSAATNAALPSRTSARSSAASIAATGDGGTAMTGDRPGFCLPGCYDVSDYRVHVLADHGHSMTRVVLAEEA